MRKYLLIFICPFFAIYQSFAIRVFKTPSDTDSIAHHTTSLVIATDYSTNTNSFGRFDNSASQPSFSPSAIYYHKSGFAVGATGFFIGNSDVSGTETTSELDLQGSYLWKLGSVFSVSPMYTHFFYSSNSGVLKRSYSDYVQLGLASEVKWWSTDLSAKYFWGDYDEFMLTGLTNATITFDNFLHKGNSLIIQPSVEINFSDINYYRYISGHYKFLEAYANRYPDATMNDLLDDLKTKTKPLIRKLWEKMLMYAYIQRRINQLSVDGNLVLSDLFSNKKQLKTSSLGFTLPVYYYFGNFSANISLSMFKPYNQPKIFGNAWTTYFSAGINYTFDW